MKRQKASDADDGHRRLELVHAACHYGTNGKLSRLGARQIVHRSRQEMLAAPSSAPTGLSEHWQRPCDIFGDDAELLARRVRFEQ
jgi:hypothetical protein